MTQFNINGQWLELLEDTSVQLTRTNELYAFDDVALERTTSFDIPATPRNLDILQLANDYHGRGTAMRRDIAATMSLGAVAYDGVLHITEYDCTERVFKAVFTFGNLQELQALRTCGKLPELGLTTMAYVTPEDMQNPVQASADITRNWSCMRHADMPCNPSVRIASIFRLLELQVPSLPTVTLPTAAAGLRIIRDKLVGFSRSVHLAMTRNPQGGSQPDTTYPPAPFNLITGTDIFNTVFDGADTHFGLATTSGGQLTQRYWTIRGIKATTPVAITFPLTMSRFWFAQKTGLTGGQPSNFYGGYWWQDGGPNAQPIITGEPLAGKTIELQTGDELYLVNLSDFVHTSAGGLEIDGWRFDLGATFPQETPTAFDVMIAGGERYYLQDNMPDITPAELCKIVAAVTGTVLRYSPDRGVWFDDLQTGGDTMTLAQVEEQGTMTRTFGDYAQHNIVTFDDADNPDRLELDYVIDNINLEERRELTVIPLSCGGAGMYNYLPAIKRGDGDTLCTYVQGYEALQRVELPRNAYIQGLCDASTSLDVTCRMTAWEYAGITPHMLLYYDGVLWTWTEMQWQEGEAVIKLAATPAAAAMSNEMAE